MYGSYVLNSVWKIAVVTNNCRANLYDYLCARTASFHINKIYLSFHLIFAMSLKAALTASKYRLNTFPGCAVYMHFHRCDKLFILLSLFQASLST